MTRPPCACNECTFQADYWNAQSLLDAIAQETFTWSGVESMGKVQGSPTETYAVAGLADGRKFVISVALLTEG
jgi:hypothetical protein